MVEALGDITLKSGECVQAAAIRGPDDAWRPRLTTLLQHKGDPWLWQNTELLTRDTGIDAWFYVLHRAGTPFAHIMTAELNGTGIFGHVWTEPADRQQGAAGRLMTRQMAHFRTRGGRALYLNTSHDSPAYHLYRRHGFAAVEPGSGAMVFTTKPLAEFEAGYFAGGAVRIGPAEWRHWPTAPALFTAGIPGVVRCSPLKLLGRKSPEGELLPWIQGASSGRAAQVIAATTPSGAVVGLAAWDHDPLSLGSIIVDVFCHPVFWSHSAALLTAVLASAPSGRRVAQADTDCPQKKSALLAAGFRITNDKPKQLPADATATRFVDVVMLESEG